MYVQIKHDVKSRLTVSSSGSLGGEGARTHVQVLANSVVASILILLDLGRSHQENRPESYCFPYGGDYFMVGITA